MATQNDLPSPMAAARLLLLAGAASAQTLFRSVGPDGRITYSDRAPARQAARQRSSAGWSRRLPRRPPRCPTICGSRESLPCHVLHGARLRALRRRAQLLGGRGVPFTERTVGSNEDIAALKALERRVVAALCDAWAASRCMVSRAGMAAALDAAGYPKTSQLPAGWRAVAATPLAPRVQTPVAPQQHHRTTTAAVAGRRQPAGRTPRRSGDRGNNPAGIRF